jgi:hypothetical protein
MNRKELIMAMNSEIKKIVSRVKETQAQLQTLLKDRTWVEDARKYAERQGKEVRKLLTTDMGKVKTFLERERKELERFQKQLPGEVKKLRKFVTTQKKELEKLLTSVRKARFTPKGKTRAGAKKTSASKKSASAST